MWHFSFSTEFITSYCSSFSAVIASEKIAFFLFFFTADVQQIDGKILGVEDHVIHTLYAG